MIIFLAMEDQDQVGSNGAFDSLKRLSNYPLRRVVGPFPLLEAPVLEPIAISAGFWPISPACAAVAGLFQ